MNDLIFGHTWEAIQRAQQGGPLHNATASLSEEVSWTERDEELLREYETEEALTAAGLHGIIDRAKQLGKLR